MQIKKINNLNWHWKIETTYNNKVCWFGVKKISNVRIVFETNTNSKIINNIVEGNFLTRRYLGLK